MATKRSLEDDMTVDDGIKKIRAEGETDAKAGDELVEIRLLIDNYEAAVIIGKGGSNVKNVRTESGAFVSILKNDSPVSKERVMTVKGPEATISKALHLIVILLMDAANQRKQTDPKGPGEPETQYTMKILIHKFLAGSIIGKGGCIIREIQETTQARISLSTEPLPGSTDKTVGITGTPDAFFAAAVRVVNQLATNALRAGSTTLPYRPGQAAAGFGAPPQQFNPYGAPQGYGAPQQGQYGAPQQSPYGAPQQNQSPYGAYGGAPQQQQQAPMGGMGGGQPGMGGAAKTEKIVIPTVCAGTVIGKGGTIIRDIKTQSGAQVSIADPEPTAPGDRVVSVTGTQQGIQTAIYLIRQRVESYQPPTGQQAM